jgi:hypothetical protein
MSVQSAIRAVSVGICVAVLAGCLGIIGFRLVFIFEVGTSLLDRDMSRFAKRSMFR